MNRHRITPAAMIVVSVLGLIALFLAVITGLLYLRGDTVAAKDVGILLGTAVAGLTGILAKTGGNDPEPGQTTVTTDTTSPVVVRGTPDASGRDWQPSADLAFE